MAMAGLVVSPLDSWRGLLRAPSFLKPQLPNHSLPSSCRQVRMMGGGPRTFPGGVTKWQWKRMQEKKSKQLLKARLMRERQLYEMRKRAELGAATVNLEKPWEKPAQAPTLFAVTADQQLQGLADRFQKPGGIDLWTEKDGPESAAFDGQPSVRSTTPYTRVVHSIDSSDAGSSRSQQTGCYFLVGDSLKLGMTIQDAYQKAISTWASWVESTVNTSRTRVFFRSFEPSHWMNSFTTRVCMVSRNPILDPGKLGKYPVSDFAGCCRTYESSCYSS